MVGEHDKQGWGSGDMKGRTMSIGAGDRVEYDGEATDAQVQWGSNADPRKLLTPGAQYTVKYVEVHSWHTKVRLVGVPGEFNSVHFRLIEAGSP